MIVHFNIQFSEKKNTLVFKITCAKIQKMQKMPTPNDYLTDKIMEDTHFIANGVVEISNSK